MLLVPAPRIKNRLLKRLFAGEDRGQQDPAVIWTQLGANHGDVVTALGAGEQFFHRPHSRHAVADDYQPPPIGGDVKHNPVSDPRMCETWRSGRRIALAQVIAPG